jgi:hypothetical protein
MFLARKGLMPYRHADNGFIVGFEAWFVLEY